MKEEIVAYDTAKLAYEKNFDISLESGFNEDGVVVSFGQYKEYYITKNIEYSNQDLPHKENTPHYPQTFVCTAPTQSLLQKWLREVHNVHINIKSYPLTLTSGEIRYYHIVRVGQFSEEYITYEMALEVGLIEGLKLIK